MTEEKAQMMQTPMMQASTHISITVEEHERLKLAEQHGRMLRRAYDLSLQENERLKKIEEAWSKPVQLSDWQRLTAEIERLKRLGELVESNWKSQCEDLLEEKKKYAEENARLKRDNELLSKQIMHREACENNLNQPFPSREFTTVCGLTIEQILQLKRLEENVKKAIQNCREQEGRYRFQNIMPKTLKQFLESLTDE
jgi:hypothetical protein